tara:strand:- start:79 stop:255 length:177 start_codon:yes stop_codon:yes gene_type:complete
MLKVKTKDELMIALINEYKMKVLLIKDEQNKTLIDEISGRIKSLEFSLGYNELEKEEE